MTNNEKLRDWLRDGEEWFAARYPDASVREQIGFRATQVADLADMAQRHQISVEQLQGLSIAALLALTPAQPVADIPTAFFREAEHKFVPGVENIDD